MKYIKEIHQTKQLLSFLSSKRRTQLIFMGILMIIGSLSEVVSIGLVIPFLGALTAPKTLYENQFFSPIINYFEITSPEQLLFPITLIFILAVIFSAITRLALLHATVRFSHAVGHDLGISIYRKTLYQNYSFHSTHNSSEIINAMVLKIGVIQGGVIRPLLVISSSLFLMLGIITALLFIDIYTSVSAICGFGLLYFLTIRLTNKRIKQNSHIIADYSTTLIKSLQEALGGIRDVLIDGSQEFFCKIYKTSDKRLRKANGDNNIIAASPRFIMEALGVSLIAILAYSLRVSSGSIEYIIPTLGALALGAQRLLPTMQQLYDAYTNLKGAQASLTDVLNFLNRNIPSYKDLPLAESANLEKDIVLKNISFRYSDDLPWVLNNINLRFMRGSRIGFAGETGSGKSTLLDILMGLINPSSGELLIDGLEVNKQNKHTWWKNIAHVPQSIYLSDSSIKENIAFGIEDKDIQFDKVERAAELAQIDSVINELSDSYKTSIGERGIRLSGGQRQRIGIARALYKSVKVIVFDEATSSLDSKTENAVMRSIENLDKNLTVFIVAHRLSTLQFCDIIHILEKGKIVKSLTYKELLKNTNLLQKKVE